MWNGWLVNNKTVDKLFDVKSMVNRIPNDVTNARIKLEQYLKSLSIFAHE